VPFLRLCCLYKTEGKLWDAVLRGHQLAFSPLLSGFMYLRWPSRKSMPISRELNEVLPANQRAAVLPLSAWKRALAVRSLRWRECCRWTSSDKPTT